MILYYLLMCECHWYQWICLIRCAVEVESLIVFGGWNSSHGDHTIHEDFIGIDVAKALRATPEDRAVRLSLKTYLASSRIIDAKEELKYLLNCHRWPVELVWYILGDVKFWNWCSWMTKNILWVTDYYIVPASYCYYYFFFSIIMMIVTYKINI
jgi:hypothetical protein